MISSENIPEIPDDVLSTGSQTVNDGGGEKLVRVDGDVSAGGLLLTAFHNLLLLTEIIFPHNRRTEADAPQCGLHPTAPPIG